MAWVALAGPAANLVMAFLWMLLFFVLQSVGVNEVFFFEMANDVNPAWFILARLWFACFIRAILSLILAVN
jgi:hypothetical protein